MDIVDMFCSPVLLAAVLFQKSNVTKPLLGEKKVLLHSGVIQQLMLNNKPALRPFYTV